MAISKKLLLIATFALGLQNITFTSPSDTDNRILELIQDLRHMNDLKLQHIAEWLEQRIFTDSFKYPLAENIILVIDHPTLTLQSKIYFFNRLIKIENDEEKREKRIKKQRDKDNRWDGIAHCTALIAPVIFFLFLGYNMITPKELLCNK